VTGTCVPRTCKALAAAHPSLTGVSTYSIRPNTRTFTAYCDLTPGNAGWTGVLTTNDLSLAYLQRFDRSADTISNYSIDGTYGATWGTTTSGDAQWSSQPWRVAVTFPFDEIRVQYSGFYNSPSGGLGLMVMETAEGANVLSFVDSHTNNSTGHSLVVGSTTVLSSSQTNITNRTDVVSRPGSTGFVTWMHGYTSAYGYTRRYFRQIWLR